MGGSHKRPNTWLERENFQPHPLTSGEERQARDLSVKFLEPGDSESFWVGEYNDLLGRWYPLERAWKLYASLPILCTLFYAFFPIGCSFAAFVISQSL